MFQDSAEDVTNSCMSLQEAKHRSRSRKGFHVFLLRYFHDFAMLTYEQQLAEVQQLYSPSNASDNDSIDSVLSPVKILNKNIVQLACKSLPNNIIKSWKHRVKWLNSHPLPGRFTTIPSEVTEHHIKQSMTRD